MTTYLLASDLSPAEATLVGEEAYEDGAAFVRFNDPDQLPAENLHSYQLDDTGNVYEFIPSFFSEKANGRYGVSGRLEDGRLSLHYTPEVGYGGYGQLNGHRIYFEPRSESLSRIVDGGDLTPLPEDEHESVCEDEPNEYHGIDGVRGEEHCDAFVEVLFLRSPEAELEFPLPGGINDFFNFVLNVVDATNESLANTKIGSKTIVPRFHTGPVDLGIDNCVILDGMLAHLRNSAAIQQLREQYDADVVVYYHENDAVFGNIGGVAVAVGADYESAFTLCNLAAEPTFRAPYTITPHELGHLFRANHTNGHLLYRPNPLFPEEYGTLMPDIVTTSTKYIRNYSNPEVDYTFDEGDVPTGVLTTADNAIRMTDHFCVVSELEQSGGFNSAITINWDNGIPLCYSSVQLEAIASSGNSGGPNSGPYSYEWRWSLGPNASTTVFSTEQFVTFTPPISSITQYYLTLEVTDISSGQSAFSSRYVGFHYCNDFALKQSSNIKSQVFNNESSEILITDTPTQISVSYGPYSKEQKALTASLYTLDGRAVLHHTHNSNPVLNTSNLSTGLYHLKVLDADGHILKTTSVWHFR